jgi:hypothetical protein
MMLALCLVLAMTGSAGEGQAQFPDVPESYLRGKGQDQVQQLRDLMDELTRRGVVQVPFKGRGPSPGIRYEAAVYFYAAYQAFVHDPKVKPRLGAHYSDIVANVRRAAATLEKELASMGVDVAAMKLHLKALALGEGFPDVPPTHWASKATRELKALGLLKGYPDGLFRGE